ncbi:tyrosine-type recombinase/integrase [Lacticaseibacillus absianus]|uniref:tyrosine-type recombinase/integrase n=1 Tax=Lacticaseibacillus absianus TaxID=2729623 RepID=UPI0015CDE760|nr:site-specific integrase [Lacticaseibacillus absianus]
MATVTSYTLKNGQTRYEVQVYAGRSPRTGKPTNFHKRGFVSSEEANNWAKMKAAEIVVHPTATGYRLNMTIESWLRDWIDHFKVNVKEGSMIIYRYQVDHYLIPKIGHYRLGQYTPDVHQRFILGLLNHGGENGAPLSRASVNIINGTLSNALKKAVSLGYLPMNPTSGVEFPRQSTSESQLHYWTREQADAFLEALHDEQDPVWYYFFLTILDLGLRKGEAMALRWSDIDLEQNTVEITKTRLYRAETGAHSQDIILDDPKYPASFRTLYMTDRLSEALIEFNRAWYSRREVVKLAPTTQLDGGQDFIFRYSTQMRHRLKVLRDRSTNGTFERARLRAGLPKIVVHDLRHTLGVLLRESGVPLEDIKDILGHKDVSTTLIYAQISPKVKKSATKKLNDYLAKSKKKSPQRAPKTDHG